MHNIFNGLIQFMSVLPFIPFLGIWLIYGTISGERKKAFLLAMDVTTFFLIISVSAMYNTIFGSGFGIYLILLILLIAGGLLGGAQNRLRGQVDIRKILKTIWRLSFFVMSVLYILFLIVGIFQYVVNNV